MIIGIVTLWDMATKVKYYGKGKNVIIGKPSLKIFYNFLSNSV